VITVGLRIALVGLMTLFGVYGLWVEPNWMDVSIHDMRADKAGDRIRVVQLSDLHIRDFGRRESEVTNRVKALEPDLVILSGDVIDRQDRLPTLHSFLAALGGVPTVAVLGNWEYWADIDLPALRDEYRHHGIALLVNEVASYRVRLRTLHIAGLDDFTAGQPDVGLFNAPFEGGTAVVVQHSPGYFDELPANIRSRPFNLCLAGHTHGGQMTFFGWPIWRPPGSGRFASGLYETTACRLYVSRGVGTSLLPVRFGARPEIAVFDL
jgi:predicted MPP superfamily phosphohydrolase